MLLSKARLVAVVAFAALCLLYQSATAKIKRQEISLEQFQRTITFNNNQISALTAERNELSMLLIQREKQDQAVREALQRDLDKTRQELDGINCYYQPWPGAVTDRLRSIY